MKISGPGQALRFHLDLYRRVHETRSTVAKHIANGTPFRTSDYPQLSQRLRLTTALTGIDGHTSINTLDNPSAALSPANVTSTWHRMSAEDQMLNDAETHYISDDIRELITAGAATMESEPLFATDLPTPNGLIVFESPMLIDDVHPITGETIPGLTMPIRAIGWTATSGIGVVRNSDEEPELHDGIMVSLYTASNDFETIYVPAFERLVGPEMREYIGDGRNLGIFLSDQTAWAFGVSWSPDAVAQPLAQTVIERRRWLLTYFRWTWQRIVRPHAYSPTRPERREAERLQRPVQDGYIKVLRLRRDREDGDTNPGLGSMLQHRIVVRGHWRRQHYRSLGPARTDDGLFNQESHRLVWILPHIKGPESGPLIVGRNVTAAVR